MNSKEVFDSEYAARLARAAQESVRAQLDLARHTAALARSTLAGETTVTEAGRDYFKAVANEGVRLGIQTGDLMRGYLEGVRSLGASWIGSAAGTSVAGPDTSSSRPASGGARPATPDAAHPPSATQGGPPGGEAPPSAPPATRASAVASAAADPLPPAKTASQSAVVSGAVSLRGPLGGSAEGAVVVVNRHPRKRVVRLMAEPLNDASGAERGVALEIDPARVTVPAGAEQTVQVRVRLADGDVEPGGTYRTVLRISGAQEASVPVTVRVDD